MESTEKLKKMEENRRNKPAPQIKALTYTSKTKYYWNTPVQVRLVFDINTNELVKFTDLVLPDVDHLMCIYNHSLEEMFNTYIEESCSDVFKLFKEEYTSRKMIIENHWGEMEDIAEAFNSSIISTPNADCWCCKESVQCGLNCKNNHTDILCGLCAFRLMSKNNSSEIECGICRAVMNVTPNNIKSSIGEFGNIYPKLAANDCAMFDHVEFLASIDPDYKLLSIVVRDEEHGW